MKHNDFMTNKPKVLNPLHHSLFLIEEITDENENTATGCLYCHVMEDRGNIGHLRTVKGGQAGHDIMK